MLPVSQQPRANGQGEEAATHIEPGVMTERQKEHSKLYDQFYDRDHGRLDVYPRDRRVRDFQANMYNPPGLEPVVPQISVEQFINGRSCVADAVVVGTITDKTSQLIASAQFLFTEYTLAVEDVYKNNPSAPINVGNDITVVRPGGKVEIGGRIVKTVDGCFLPFTLGSRVLLFLKYVPKTGSYDSLIGRGSFKIDNGALVPLTHQNVPGFNGHNAVEFTPSISSAISTSCSK